jgi:gliding motility-associated-like protein
LNNDGVNDIVVGASEDDDAGLNKGAIYILYLNSDGTVQSFAKIHEGTPGFMGDLTGEALFGWAVSYMGDVNGDGNIEILVGAQRDNVSGSEEGSVWVVSINNTGGIVQTTEISVATSAALAGVVTPGSRFGSSVTLVHDLWCDNSPDIAVGLQAFGANDEGAVFLIDLDANFNAQGVLVIAEGLAGLQATLDPLDRFGWGLDVMYDYNGDGFSELMVGSVNFDDGGTNIGGTWLLSLNPSSSESVLLDSTWFCSDNEISLFPESPVQNILWSTGETTDTIMVSTTGPIWVSGTIGGCIMTDTTVVIFDDVQLPELSDTAVCGELILEVLYPNYDVIWSTGETSEQIQITQSGTYSVSLVGQCGTLSTEFTVSVATETFADFLTRSKPIEFLDPNVQFVNESNGATTYEWHFGDGQVSFEENPEHVYDESGVYLVMLVAYGTDGLECVDTTYGYVSVDPMFTFYVPNAFTPDGDGINDTWGGVGLNFEYESFELEIFDRWGGLIWQTDNLFKGWDGTHMKSGNRVKQGMYVYQFRLRQFDTFEPKVFKGTVTLYRHN